MRYKGAKELAAKAVNTAIAPWGVDNNVPQEFIDAVIDAVAELLVEQYYNNSNSEDV